MSDELPPPPKLSSTDAGSGAGAATGSGSGPSGPAPTGAAATGAAPAGLTATTPTGANATGVGSTGPGATGTTGAGGTGAVPPVGSPTGSLATGISGATGPTGAVTGAIGPAAGGGRPARRRLPWACSVGARVLGTAMNVLGQVGALAAAFYFDGDEWWWYAILVTSILVAVAGIGILWYCFADPARGGGFGAALLGIAAFILSIAAAVTVIVYVLPVSEAQHPGWTDWVNFIAPAAGILSAAGAAVAFAAWDRDRSTPDRANPGLYGELVRRWDGLNGRVTTLCGASAEQAPAGVGAAVDGQSACAEARAQRDFVGQALGRWPGADGRTRTERDVRWVLGTGYVELGARLHDAEEALFVVDSEDAVVGFGLRDEMRLKDSNIRNEDDFLSKLRRAVFVLDGAAFLTPAPAQAPLTPEEDCERGRRLARVALRDVRHALNEFRDGRREGLVRARNHLTAVGTLTGLAAYVLLALAVLVDAPASTIIAASTFYLVGAVIGLFDQLRLSSRGAAQSGEDFGLARARLIYAPILSGLAAVGGVLVTAMLYAQLSGSILAYPRGEPAPSPPPAVSGSPIATATPSPTPNLSPSPTAGVSPTPTPSAVGLAVGLAFQPAADTPTPTPTPTETATATPSPTPTPIPTRPEVPLLEPPPVEDIFNLDVNRFGLVIAAVFGLTPSLLVNRLQDQADRIKRDLRSTNAEETSASS